MTRIRMTKAESLFLEAWYDLDYTIYSGNMPQVYGQYRILSRLTNVQMVFSFAVPEVKVLIKLVSEQPPLTVEASEQAEYDSFAQDGWTVVQVYLDPNNHDKKILQAYLRRLIQVDSTFKEFISRWRSVELV